MSFRLGNFKPAAIVRIIFLCITIFIFSYLLPKDGFVMSKVIVGLLIVYQAYSLIHVVEKTNRDINRFFDSIQNNDFSQTFIYNDTGDSVDQLKKSFNHVIKSFLELRSEKEEHYLHLQTVIKHAGIGLISFKEDGSVELMNSAAKQLLNIDSLKTIKSIDQLDQPLKDILPQLKTGSSASVKVTFTGNAMYLSFHAARFRLRDETYTLISIKDIQSEIEREQMGKELEIAGNVQKSLLPRENPIIPGFDSAGMCRPAKEVGGDYYDFISIGDNKLALIIGDVSGKGTSASFYMTLTKGYIQSNMKSGLSPKEVLIKVNELILETIPKKSFVTLFLAVLDWKTRKITCARAGHTPAIHFSSHQGSAVSVKPEGIALGLSKSKVFSATICEQEIQMETGDWFILYTDGFTEAMDSNSNEFGKHRLIRLTEDYCGKRADELLEAIYSDVQAFCRPAAAHDDMSMIVLKAL